MPQKQYFFTGGALSPNAASYVIRDADEVLLDQLRAGNFCYILDSRQMGKTSLIARAANNLRSSGTKVAVVDLTVCGVNVNADEWYRNQILAIGNGLDLEDEVEDFWPANGHLGAVSRYVAAIRFVLRRIPRPTRVVIFIDEIDYVRLVRKNGIQTDELFAAIRACYNERSHDVEIERVAFCLLGTALPRDLLSNPETTPFNIGQRIDLKDFTFHQSGALAAGLGKAPKVAAVLVRRILYWTGGQPYLTQTLCKAVAQDTAARSASDVDRICRGVFLTPGNDETVDAHYQQVSDRILKREQFRKDNLTLYANLLRRRRLKRQFGLLITRLLFDQKLVADDDTRSAVNGLKLAGLARSENGHLSIRNEIYAQRFDAQWIDRHMQEPEQRAVKEAYRRGLRYAALAAISAVSLLALIAASFIIARMNESQRELHQVNSKQKALLSENESYARRLKYALADVTQAGDDLRQKVKDLAKARDQAEDAKNEAKRLQSEAQTAVEVEKKLRKDFEGKALEAETAASRTRALEAAAEKEAKKYEALEREASAGKIALQATLLQKDSPQSLPESLSTGIESMARFPTLFGDQAIRSALDLLPSKAYILPAPGTTQWHSSSAEGRFFVRVDVSNQAQFIFHRWDVENPSKHDSMAFSNTQSSTAVDAIISPEGDYLAILTASRSDPIVEINTKISVEIRSWDGAPAPRPPFRSPACGTGAVAFAGTILASMPCAGNTIELFDVSNGVLRSPLTSQSNLPLSSAPVLVGDRQGKYILERPSPRFRPDDPGLTELLRIWSIDRRPETPVRDKRVSKTKSDSILRLKRSTKVERATFDPTGRFVALLEKGKIQVWHFQSNTSPDILLPDYVQVSDMVFNKTGTFLCVASSDNAAIIYDSESGKEVKRFSHSSAVSRVRFSSDGLSLATAGNDKTARVWSLSTGHELARMPLSGDPQEVGFASNDRALITLIQGRESTAVIWQSSAGSGTQSWSAPTGTNSVSFDPNSSHLITAGVSKTTDDESSATIYRTGEWQQPKARIFMGSPTNKLVVSSRGILATIGSGIFQTWDTQTGGRLWSSPQSGGSNNFATFSNSGVLIARALIDSGVLKLSVANTADGSPSASIEIQLPNWNALAERYGNEGFQLAFSPEENALLFTIGSSSFCGLNEWTFAQGSAWKPLVTCNSKAWSRMSDDGSRFLVGEPGGITVYDFSGHHLLTHKTTKPFGQVHSVSRDGKFIASSSLIIDLTSPSGPITDLPNEAGNPLIFTARSKYLVTNSVMTGVGLFELSSHVFKPLIGQKTGDKTEVNVLGGDLAERYLALRISAKRQTASILETDDFVSVYDLSNISAAPQKLLGFSLMAFAPDGTNVVGVNNLPLPSVDFPDARSAKGGAIIWWVPDGANRAFSYDQHGLSALALSPDGSLIAVGGLKSESRGSEQLTVSSIKRNGAEISTTPKLTIPLDHTADWMAFSPTSGHLALTAGNVLLVVGLTPSAPPTSRRFLDRIIGAAFARTQPLLAFSTLHRLEMVDLSSSRSFQPVVYGDDTVERIAMDDSYLAVATRAKTDVSIELRKIHPDRLQTEREIRFPKPLNSLNSMVFSPDGSHLAIATGQNVAYVWDLRTDTVEELTHKVAISAISFAPNDPAFVMTRSSQSVHVWHWADQTEVARISQNALLNEAVFTPDGRYLLTLASNGEATKHLWRSNDLIAHACQRLGDSAPESCNAFRAH